MFSTKNDIKSKDPFLIEESDIFSDLEKKKGTSLFLGKYALKEVTAVLKKRSFIREAQRRKLWPLEYALDSSQYPPLQRFQIFHECRDPGRLIVDLKIKEGNLRLKELASGQLQIPELKYLVLEWLTLQNPRRTFSGGGAPLPGQKHPGLNIGRKVLKLFAYLARLDKCGGLLAFPAYFHNALLFSRKFHFLNPEKEGEIIAVRKAFSGISFKHLAWIVHVGCIFLEGYGPYEWKAEEQIYPLHGSLKEYFESNAYKSKVRESAVRKLYRIDRNCLRKKMDDLPPSLYPEMKNLL